jgi:hypothetical protein
MYSDIRPVSVPAPVQRESIAYSEATSGFEQEIFQSFDELMIDSSTERYASLPFQSSLIHMMNSDDAAFGLAASASAHASQDSHSDKYDSMLFSDDGSEYSQ